jgi:hypothetical protein
MSVLGVWHVWGGIRPPIVVYIIQGGPCRFNAGTHAHAQWHMGIWQRMPWSWMAVDPPGAWVLTIDHPPSPSRHSRQ